MQNIMKYKQEEYHTLAEYYLDMACKNLPVVNQAISKYGDVSLSDYLQNFIHKPKPSYQQQDDFLEAVHRYAAPLLGESLAQQTVRDLAANPVVLTSNHLGVEYSFQSIQGSIFFSLNPIAGNSSATTVPVFSFGNISLNNPTYPRGVVLYHVNSDKLDQMPVKLPIFPDRSKNQIAGVAPPFDRAMIRRAEARLGILVQNKRVFRKVADTMQEIFQEAYSDDSVMALPDYSQQSVVLNRRIWKQLFSDPSMIPELAYLEIEKIAEMILISDLFDPKSLAWLVMFDPDLRQHIFEALDGIRNGKAIFFWGIDERGKSFNLEMGYLGNNEILRGVDARGKVWEIPFTPQSIIDGLNKKRLMPSLFTCFLTLSFARGVICVGGYFQAEYLPAMQHGIVTALQKTGYNEIAHLVAQVPTDCYLSGMSGIMTKTEDDCLIPAGSAEIIAGGGITDKDIEQMLSLTVREAHIAGLFETVPDIVPKELRVPGRKKELASDCQQLLEGKMVLK